VPWGYHMSSGKIAASLSTTGGAGLATLIGAAGGKFHDVPQLIIGALSSSTTDGPEALQNTYPTGFNTIGIYQKLLGTDNVAIIGKKNLEGNRIVGLEDTIHQVMEALTRNRPAAILLHPDILSKRIDHDFNVSWPEVQRVTDYQGLGKFISSFPNETKGKKVVIYVGEEATRYNGISQKIKALAGKLGAPVIYSMNSANAVAHDDPHAAGYIHLGFNDFSYNLWKSLTKSDTVIAIGVDPGEYELNSDNFPGNVWHLTNSEDAYGWKDGGFVHRVNGEYRQIKGDLELNLESMIQKLSGISIDNIKIEVPGNLNTNNNYGPIQEGTVDLVEFFPQYFDSLEPGTIVIPDVCQAYKDMQRVQGRPHKNGKVWSSHRDSFMGESYGIAIGAKLANPDAQVDIHIGDGCFEYIGGALDRTRDFGLRMFVYANGTHHIVDRGIDVIDPRIARERHHAVVPNPDYVKLAEAHGWIGKTLEPNLSNLHEIMGYKQQQSMLIEIPVDGMRVIGQNARLFNLGNQGNL